LACGVTDETGRVCFTGLMLGTYYVEETLNNEWYTEGPTMKQVVVDESGECVGEYFLNIRYGKICVFKYEDLNGDGVWQEGEPGVGGVTIEVWQSCELVRTDVTNESGSVCFDMLRFGDYIVRENLAASHMDCCWYNSTDGMVEVTLSAQDREELVSFGNVRFGMICGYKYYDENLNGQFDPCTETAVPDWEIQLWKDGMLWAMTHTDRNGMYCFCHLEFGEYTVVEVMQEGWYATGPTQDVVVIDESGERGNVNFFNAQNGWICVYKYEDLNGDGVWQEGEPAVLGVTIVVCHDGQQVACGVTNEEGKVCFELRVGEYVVREMLTCCWYTTSDNPQVVVLDGPRADVTFLNVRYGCICGYKFNDANMNGVWDMCTEEGIAGWGIQLWKDGQMIGWTLTDADGHYAFCGLRIGDYTVKECMRDGWLATSPPEIQVSLERSGQLVSDINFLNFFANPCICVDKDMSAELYEFMSHTQGYWKNHPCDWVVLGILPGDLFPWVDLSVYPDGLTYMEVFNTPVKGDATLILAHQYIAAKLNDLMWGAPDGYVEFITDAEEFLAAHPVGSDPQDCDRNIATHLAGILASYNEGEFCAGVPMGLLTYTINMVNCGNIALYNVAVYDTLLNQWFHLSDCGDLDGILDIGETWT
ncbi:MAG: hypothetical protein MIO90_04675, partial [Methanomassiliicoccales archaeon]|nr:hypothetical protein [Methanomassiliicoccales archaeon]